jgi:3-hydroxyisobutyrate dehydrogenase
MDKVIGWIGVGSMGSRMAVNLSKSGYSIIVADKISTEAAPKNAEVATNNQELAQKAEVVIFSVPAGPDTLTIAQEFIKTPDRIVKTVIDTSTIGIPHAREAFELFKAHGIEYIDAPVSGGIAGAEAGTLAVMVGCQLDSFDKFKPILKCIGQNIIHVGSKAGQGQTVKLLNNFLSATAMAATSEAMAFGTANGLDMKAILDVVNVSSGRNTATLDKFPNRIVTEAYNGGFATKMMAKDVRLYVENVLTTGSAVRLGPLVADTFAQLEKFETNSDFTKIYPFIRDKHFSD